MLRACEGSTGTLSCASGTIDVLDATYGRTDDASVCPHPVRILTLEFHWNFDRHNTEPTPLLP